MLDLTLTPHTTGERQLLADLNRWRRTTPTSSPNRWDTTFPGWWRRNDGRADLQIDGNMIRVNLYDRHGFNTQLASVQVATVRQGVDLLVALGLLPVEFSTAYRVVWS